MDKWRTFGVQLSTVRTWPTPAFLSKMSISITGDAIVEVSIWEATTGVDWCEVLLLKTSREVGLMQTTSGIHDCTIHKSQVQ